MTAAVALAEKRLDNLKNNYSGFLLENKGLTLSLHYRLVKKHLVKQLLKQAKKIIFPFQNKRLLKILAGKKVLEVQPALLWNKGYWAKFLCQKIGKKLIPIYIGDDLSDENVFKILKSGITIKIGKDHASQAMYYCQNVKQIKVFLGWFLNILRTNQKSIN